MDTAKSYTTGFPPIVTTGPGNPEAIKYGKLWERPEYRVVAPGEALASTFLAVAAPRPRSHVLDFGAGTGRGALMLALLGNLRVTMLDFVRNSLDPEIQQALETQKDHLAFLKADLEQPIPLVAPYGFCTDVMEHIPLDKVDRVLTNILKAAQHVFFSISTVPDSCGQLIGEALHLTVRPAAWWRDQFLAHDAVIHWSEVTDTSCAFYLSAWASGQAITDSGVLNNEERAVREHVKINTAAGWKTVQPHITNTIDCMIVGSGPTLPDHLDEIRRLRAEGVKLITLNGAYNWCLDHDLVPSAQVMVDSREFNKRFTKPVTDTTIYLIASQCHPTVLEGLPHERTYLFHAAPGLIKDLLDTAYPDGWSSVPGGSTVLLRAIPLMRLLGYRRFHLFGCDSCIRTDDTGEIHHAISQPENDGNISIPVILSGSDRVFLCHPWMVSQANEFMGLIKMLGGEIELEIHGDGLLRHLLVTGAALAALDDVQQGAT